MYPGTTDQPGLTFEFKPGLSLILGANGIGKTTFISILFRSLTGPYELPTATLTGDLGSARIQAIRMPSYARSVFANRVMNGASDAVVTLTFMLNDTSVVISRSLHDLSLRQVIIDGLITHLAEEDLQAEICRLAGVWSFGDWILLLRHMIFYFEDRRALVWDQSAQRQILRILFMQPDMSEVWIKKEREVLELDSRMRNLQSAVSREERALASEVAKSEGAKDIRAELETIEKLLTSDSADRETLQYDLVGIEAARQDRRLSYLQKEQERESAFREFENAKLIAIASRFPSRSDTARYILAQLMTDNTCLVCGSEVPGVVEELTQRIEDSLCVVCASDISESEILAESSELADKRVQVSLRQLNDCDVAQESAANALKEIESAFSQHVLTIQELNTSIAKKSARLAELVKLLPPEESKLHRKQAETAALRSSVESQRQMLQELRTSFRSFIEIRNKEIADKASDVVASFHSFARGFLLEDCTLSWAPRKSRLGETGESFDFPFFELDLSGSDFNSTVRRTGPEQVSESQREFIDLSFRMALTSTAGAHGFTSLLIDAPESSLDAVFVVRAASVLAKFARATVENRLVVTSNLVEGQLLPLLLKTAESDNHNFERLLNLFDIAEPTEAIRQLHDEYQERIESLLASLGDNS